MIKTAQCSTETSLKIICKLMIAVQFVLCHANLSRVLFGMNVLLKNQLTTLRDSVVDVVMHLKSKTS